MAACADGANCRANCTAHTQVAMRSRTVSRAVHRRTRGVRCIVDVSFAVWIIGQEYFPSVKPWEETFG